ncbi:MAG: hypothetical protein IJV83_02855 [Clostridia bacterium]|nr:hypothetical protein [Clostridia bacterium]
MEKTKYSDNRLAEELDVIVLINNTLKPLGFPSGSLGRLTYSYTGRGRRMYALLFAKDGKRKEVPLRLRDFRVLDERNRRDCALMTQLPALNAASESLLQEKTAVY